MSNKEINKKQINNPIENTGLSIKTTYLLKRLGCNSIKDFIGQEPVDYSSMYNKITNLPKILNMTPEECQHCYIELLDYLKYYEIEFKKPKRPDLEGQIKEEQYNEVFQNIESKLAQHFNIENQKVEKYLDNIITEIIDIANPQIIELNDIETRIIRIVCGIYTRGKEQTFEQATQFLKSKGINIEENKVGLIFYETLEKIKNELSKQGMQKNYVILK